MCEREENRLRKGTGQCCLPALKWSLLQPEASRERRWWRGSPGWLMSAFREETRAFMRCMQRAQAAAERSPEPEDTQNRSRPGAFVLSWARFSHNGGSGRAVDCHIKSKEFSILIQPFLWP